jgi:alkyl hydroperoxide reductase subunit AhpC
MKKIFILLLSLISFHAFALQLGDQVPNFSAETTKGNINFYDWSNNKWVVLFSHPGDFTPVCTTELAQVAYLQPDFQSRDVKLIGLSVDSLEDHKEWIPHVNSFKNQINQELSLENSLNKITSLFDDRPDVDYPIIADTSMDIAKLFDMIHPNANPNESAFGIKHKATIRSVFIIDPHQKIQTILTYPMHVGRNFDEIIRTIDALQVAAKYKVSTPANWQPGDDVIVPNYITNDMIKDHYDTEDFTQYQDYLRMIEHPGFFKGNKNRSKSGINKK